MPPGPLTARIDEYLDAHDAPRHTELGHPRSSQAACLQIFAPALERDEVALRGLVTALRASAAQLGLELQEVERCDFEVPHRPSCRAPSCRVAADMREVAGERGPFTTRLDAALALRCRRGAASVRVLLGIEFKYTEPELGCCGGFRSMGFAEEGARACIGPGARTGLCYLRHQERREYLRPGALTDMFGRDVLGDDGPCPFVGPLNQLLRSHFTVRRLAATFGCDEAVFAVLHDGRNESLRMPERAIPSQPPFTEGPLERYRDLLRPGLRASFCILTTQDVIEAYCAAAGATRPQWLQALIARYRWAR